MNEKTHSSTLNYYDAIARGYKNLYHEEQILKINQIKEFFPNSGIVLDLGSGDGVLNQYFFNNKKVKLISCDLSFELLKLNSNKNKIQASAQNLPFKNNSIDFISSFTMLQDVPDPKLAISEILRVSKKNSIIILSFLKLAKYLDIILEEINNKNNFEIIKKYEEIKDFIFVLKKV